MPNKISFIASKQKLIVYAVLTAVTLAVYWQVHQFEFVNFDDNLLVFENRHIQTRINPEAIRWSFTTNQADLWSPVLWLSFLLEYQFHGLTAGGYHVTNLILHVLGALLLFWLFDRMTGALWPSAFVAAVFALHPLHVESVAWITERKDVLSAFFWMLTLCLYAYYTEKPLIRRYLPVIFTFILALMSKPMVVTLPVMMILLDYWPLKRFETRQGKAKILLWQLKEKMPLFIPAAIFSFITFYVQYYIPSMKHLQSLERTPLDLRLANAAVSFVTYLEKTFWPHDMSVFYPFPIQIPAWQISGAFLLILVISIAVIAGVKRFPFLFVGWFWYLIAILPVIKIMQIGNDAMADRYHYLPSIGISVMLAWGIPLLFSGDNVLRKVLFPAAISFLSILTFLTWHQCGYWRNSIGLWNHALCVIKDNDAACSNGDIVPAKTGKDNSDYSTATGINPYAAYPFNNRGNAYARLGQYERAIEDFDKAICLKGNIEFAFNNRGNAYAAIGRHERAIEDYTKAVRLKGNYDIALNNRGTSYAALGQHARAIEDYTEAVRLKTDFAEAYYNRAQSYALIGRHEHAVTDYDEVIRLKPDIAEAHYNKACSLAIQKKAAQACQSLQSALKLGYNDHNKIKKDRDLENIRNNPCFIELLKESKK